MSRTWFLSIFILFVAAVPAVAAGSDRIAPSLSRGLTLPALYASFAALNVYDAASTIGAMKRGAVEANPLVAGIAGHPAALWAVKGGVTAASILASENLWRQGHRRQAIVLMVASNSIMTAVAAHNASVIRGLR
jgi:hypothetical protein